MKNNRFLVLALAALSVGALASCRGKDSPVEVPVEEGKVTFYFQEGENSVELNSYESYFLTGGWIGFATGTNALEMTRLEDTNTYYVIADAPDTSLSQGNEYQIVRGYNASSNMSSSKLGLQWNDKYKSDEELGYEALKNPTFTYVDGDKTINLGTHTFSTSVATPSKPLKNYTLKFTFTTSVPTYGQPMIFGSLNGWLTPSSDKTDEENTKIINEAKLVTSDPERKVWTKTYAELYADSYEYKLLVEYTSATTEISWNACDGYEQNMPLEVLESDGDDFILDISASMDFDAKLPDPTKAAKIKFIFENSGEGVLAENVAPGICGNFTNWKYTAMTLEDKVWTLELTVVVGNFECGIINMNEGGTSWVNAIKGEGGNISFVTTLETKTVTFYGDYSKLGVEESTITKTTLVA